MTAWGKSRKIFNKISRFDTALFLQAIHFFPLIPKKGNKGENPAFFPAGYKKEKPGGLLFYRTGGSEICHLHRRIKGNLHLVRRTP